MITITISHTLHIFEAADPAAAHPDELWDSLVHKAENPVRYVPSITAARVLERHPDGFVREIVLRGRDRFRERVVLEPRRRVVFHQLDDPDLALITNEIGIDQAGATTYTLTVTMSPNGVHRSRSEPGFLEASDTIFFDTARGTVNSLRLIATGGSEPARSR